MKNKKTNQQKSNRKNRVRAKLISRSALPRLITTRSLRYTWAQVVDNSGSVLVSASSKKYQDGSKTDQAAKVGEEIAANLKKKKIKAVVLDRGANRYHGRVKALATAVKKSGIKI